MTRKYGGKIASPGINLLNKIKCLLYSTIRIGIIQPSKSPCNCRRYLRTTTQTNDGIDNDESKRNLSNPEEVEGYSILLSTHTLKLDRQFNIYGSKC